MKLSKFILQLLTKPKIFLIKIVKYRKYCNIIILTVKNIENALGTHFENFFLDFPKNISKSYQLTYSGTIFTPIFIKIFGQFFMPIIYANFLCQFYPDRFRYQFFGQKLFEASFGWTRKSLKTELSKTG